MSPQANIVSPQASIVGPYKKKKARDMGRMPGEDGGRDWMMCQQCKKH